MREKSLYQAVNRAVPKTIHRQSMTGATMVNNGTPDFYYDGPRSFLWVEYKQLNAMPRSGMARGAYTELQLMWMERRHRNGGHVVGIVGLPNRTAVIQTTPDAWRQGSSTGTALSIKEVAAWITEFCGGSCSQE